jgi:integrase
MPKLTKSLPKYRRHKASGQAIVTLSGVDHYLGHYGTKASRIEYDRMIGEWVAAGRTLTVTDDEGLTIAELILRYHREHVVSHYTKAGRATSEQHDIASAMRPLKELYGTTPAASFGPLALKSVRQRYVDQGFARGTCNKHLHRVRRMFRWGVENELIKPSVWQSLSAVEPLRKGKTKARETEPIGPVADSIVQTTLPHLPEVVSDMVRFQRLTGCRPQDVCGLRPCDVDSASEVWVYTPPQHKTEHLGKRRSVYIGPKAQNVLRKYLLRPKESYCFSPEDSERRRKAELHANRKTPLHYGNRPRRRWRRRLGDRYNTAAYRHSINRACDKAFPVPEGSKPEQARKWIIEHRWAPNRLRHSAATEIRKRFGLEAAQVILGHTTADTTQIYAERDEARAVEVMKQVG